MPYPRRTLASLGLLFVLGCSSSDDGVAGRPKTYPVDGLVLYNGNPVEGATVVFNSPTENRGAAGLTDAQGRFTLKTFKPGDGAVAGDVAELGGALGDDPALRGIADDGCGQGVFGLVLERRDQGDDEQHQCASDDVVVEPVEQQRSEDGEASHGDRGDCG